MFCVDTSHPTTFTVPLRQLLSALTWSISARTAVVLLVISVLTAVISLFSDSEWSARAFSSSSLITEDMSCLKEDGEDISCD